MMPCTVHLHVGAEVERQLSTQVNSLRDDFREQSLSSSEHTTRLESLQAELKVVACCESADVELCARTHSSGGGSDPRERAQRSLNQILRPPTSRDGTALHVCVCVCVCVCGVQIKMLAERKVELERRLHAMLEENELLQSSVDELRERTMLLERHSHHKDLQLRQSQAELQEAQLCARSALTCGGTTLTDSALSTDSSMDESSETSSAKDVPTGSLHTGLLGAPETHPEPAGRKRVHDLYEEEQHKAHSNQEEVLQLHSQVALLSVEMLSLREDNDRIRTMSEVREPSEQLQTAHQRPGRRHRQEEGGGDGAAKCRIDIMSLNSQLLDAIQQKLNLSQQLEAWQFASSGLFTVWLLWFLI
ncbi:hypothetical protein KUCAC02_032865 [Chaenocephalus aceratus]|nr:hypothetical protein KUCAC02_032865 [Chaenocephalus aceratus]